MDKQKAIRHYPLTCMQSEMLLEWEENHDMTQYNMAFHFHFDHKWITHEMFSQAVATILRQNPYLYNRFVRVDAGEVAPQKHYNDPTLLVRQYPEMNQDIKPTFLEMTDEEFEVFVNTPTPPFDPFNEPMVRFTLIDLPTGQAIVQDTFHPLTDGVSIKSLSVMLGLALEGKPLEYQGMKPYEQAEQLYEACNTDQYLREKTFYEEKMKTFTGLTDFCRHTDNIEEAWGESIKNLFVLPVEPIHAWCERQGVSEADYTMAAYMKAISIMTGERSVWAYTSNHNRSKERTQLPLLGNYIKPMLLNITVEPDDNMLCLCRKMKREMFSLLRRNIFPISHYFTERGLSDYGTEILYNGHYMTLQIYNPGHPHYAPHSWFNFGLTLNHIYCTVWQKGYTYEFEVECSDALYTKEQVGHFMSIYQKVLVDALAT